MLSRCYILSIQGHMACFLTICVMFRGTHELSQSLLVFTHRGKCLPNNAGNTGGKSIDLNDKRNLAKSPAWGIVCIVVAFAAGMILQMHDRSSDGSGTIDWPVWFAILAFLVPCGLLLLGIWLLVPRQSDNH